MNRKRVLWTALSALLMLTAFTPLYAQSPWSAYLFNPDSGQLLQVTSEGAQTAYALGAGDGAYLSNYDLAFNADGTWAAWCAMTYPTENNPGQTTARLIVRDLPAQSNLVEMDLGPVTACRTGAGAFDDSGTRLAFSILDTTTSTDPNQAAIPLTWRLEILDLSTGQVSYKLDHTHPGIQEDLSRFSFQPYLRTFLGDQVVFAMLPFATEGSDGLPAYRWSLTTNNLEAVEGWGNLSLDWLPSTGETVRAAYNPELPVGDPGGPVPLYNQVVVSGAQGVEYPVYKLVDNQWVITGTAFIDDGQQIAIQLLSSFDYNQPNFQQVQRWIAVDRSGQVSDLFSPPGFTELLTAPGGYLTLEATQIGDNGQQSYSLNYRTGGQSRTVWQAEATPPSYWLLAWVTPGPAVPNPAAFSEVP